VFLIAVSAAWARPVSAEVDVAVFEAVAGEPAGGGAVIGGRVAVGGEEDELERVGE
jgi:hypothetical protein